MSALSDKYRLEARLGGGGMAEVFVASVVGAEGFARRVAIKRVLPGYSDNPQFGRMFVDEAKISSRLQHPNVVSVLDFDRDAEGRLYLVMELVEGKDLDALVATGPLPFPVVVFVIAEVLRGLGYAHDLPVLDDAQFAGSQTVRGMRGIVHRDVSPHNVLVSWEGSVKVSDFGIAKARMADNATASQFIKGKPAYMSPEQANGEQLDGRSDLFAVGIMLWEMLCGRRLFVGEDTRAMLAAVLFGQIPRPRAVRSDVPKDLDRVAMKLLERERNARYATAEHAIADLLACNAAPRDGREQLKRTMAERFPFEAPIRHSLRRDHAGDSGPALAPHLLASHEKPTVALAAAAAPGSASAPGLVATPGLAAAPTVASTPGAASAPAMGSAPGIGSAPAMGSPGLTPSASWGQAAGAALSSSPAVAPFGTGAGAAGASVTAMRSASTATMRPAPITPLVLGPRRARWPFVVAGVAVISAIVAVAIVASRNGMTPSPPRLDAASSSSSSRPGDATNAPDTPQIGVKSADAGPSSTLDSSAARGNPAVHDANERAGASTGAREAGSGSASFVPHGNGGSAVAGEATGGEPARVVESGVRGDAAAAARQATAGAQGSASSGAQGSASSGPDGDGLRPARARSQAAQKRGRLKITAFPALTVYVDRKKMHDTPFDEEIPVGRHVVRLVNRDTGHDESFTVVIREDAPIAIHRE